jgi:aminoglycoside phosphotransferase (APT) family kinase protein
VVVPLVWEHRDLGLGNIFETPATIGVIDWEGSARGPALCDMLFLAARWLATATDDATDDATSRALLRLASVTSVSSDPAVAAAIGAVRRYSAALDVPVILHPVLLVLTCVRLALERDARRLESGADRAEPNAYAELVTKLAADPEATMRWGVRT